MTTGRQNRYAVIMDSVKSIPRGKVSTYGDIARLSGFPGCARVVGYALRALPAHSGVAWHRVVNSSGKISFPPGSDSYEAQKLLLEQEGVRFENNKIDLKIFSWLDYRKKEQNEKRRTPGHSRREIFERK